ncbi:MAG: hypothetical protein KKF44_06600 [Nanoarchaeota archaeon]|nr:hypothetical protein [Nanoarchaeota archaeon]
MIFPVLFIGFIIGLMILITWGIRRKRIPKTETGLQIVVSTISVVSGLSYILTGILNFLNNWINWIPKIEIPLEEALGILMVAGLGFLLIGLHELKRNFSRKR